MMWVMAKRCACGCVYKTEADWLRLMLAYIHYDGYETIESRHCSCESTISVAVYSGKRVILRHKELGLTIPFTETLAKA